MIILRLLLLLTNLHLKLLSTQGTGADKLLSTQRVKYTRKQKEKQISGNIKNNPKAFWKYTKSKTKSSSAISSLHMNPSDTNSITIDNSKVKANILNEYFASVFTTEPNCEFCELEEILMSNHKYT